MADTVREREETSQSILHVSNEQSIKSSIIFLTRPPEWLVSAYRTSKGSDEQTRHVTPTVELT